MSSRATVSQRIRNAARHRDIRFLLHFTLTRNLSNIVQHGILPREMLYPAEFAAYTGAQHRLDASDQAVSFSISGASQKIFSAKSRDSKQAEWVMLFIDPSILWTHNCRFCFRNAATREMLNHRGFLGGPWAFEQMFSDEMAPTRFKGQAYRAETVIPSFLPTDPDAEVQIIGSVSADQIIGAWTCRNDHAAAIQGELDKIPGPERDVLVEEFNTASNGYSEWIVPRFML
ncbi:DarT ssDNA thymidine ADP-ribosyltransferase family protein [Thiosulfatihalobacter marinus]|uniref:DarT ssDNA thymidine ADP-ribosyltransferase family protein n=1 Tax=Thiosulfatihalobacter marinus TaxID=2792481 RepID=UPI0018D74EC2|nr:DarT ssDNA thymidine ADP-ribosyltransferase family protein [Thiosulfatihalobacter marinus]